MKDTYSFTDFVKIIETLRSEQGCPWDREQTHESLKTCMIEEAYEVVEGIDRGTNGQGYENLCEELGDVLMQVVLHSQIAKEAGEFTLEDVVDGIAKKMIRRHPHVFGPEKSEIAPEELNKQWDEIKKTEKKDQEDSVRSIMDSVPKAFPALVRAQKITKKAAMECASDLTVDEAQKRVSKRLFELEKAVREGRKIQAEESYGALLLDLANLARFLQLNAENSLTNATNKFINRFIDVEHLARANGAHLCELPMNELNALWEQRE